MRDRLHQAGTHVSYDAVMRLPGLRSTANATLMVFVAGVLQIDVNDFETLYAQLVGQHLTVWGGYWGAPERGLFVLYDGPCLVFEELGPEWER